MKNYLLLNLFLSTIGGIVLNAQINSSKSVDHQNFNKQNQLSLFDKTILANSSLSLDNEDLNLRDANSKHFRNSDGSYTAIINAAPIHYINKGNWVEINTNLIKDSYGFANKANIMESYFGNTALQGLTSVTSEGAVHEFQNVKFYFEKNNQELNVVNANNSPATSTFNQLIFENIYGDIDARYTVESGKRKLEFLVPSLNALGSIPSAAEYFVVSEQVLLPENWSIAKTNYGWNVLDEQGKVVYLYHNANTYDSKDFGLFNNNTKMEYLKMEIS